MMVYNFVEIVLMSCSRHVSFYGWVKSVLVDFCKLCRSTLEEVKFLQKQRERRSGVVANQLAQPLGTVPKVPDKGEGEGEKEEQVLQDTFAQETAVTIEDPNM